MKRDEAISRLRQHEADLKRFGVERRYMFSSTAPGEAGDDPEFTDKALFQDSVYQVERPPPFLVRYSTHATLATGA